MKPKKSSARKKNTSPKKGVGNTPFYAGLKSKIKPVKHKAPKQERFSEPAEDSYRPHKKHSDSHIQPRKRKSMLDDAFARNILMALPERPDAEGVHNGLEPLAAYPYMTEQMVKVSAFTKFWMFKIGGAYRRRLCQGRN